MTHTHEKAVTTKKGEKPSTLVAGEAINQITSIINRLDMEDRLPVLESLILLYSGCTVNFEYRIRF